MAKEIKISGIVGKCSDSEYRNILADCGGIIKVRDFILSNCGKYAEGDRIIVTINTGKKDEFYYPPKP